VTFKLCPNGHVFERVSNNICPYCHMVATDIVDEMINHRELKPAKPAHDKINPVCGWLVCLEGLRQGYSFNLYKGKNFIGRGKDMDVCLLGDDTVAYNNHATIVYDYKEHHFMLLPGALGDDLYLDETAVYKPTLLSDRNMRALFNI